MTVRLTQYPGSNRYRCDGCSSEFAFVGDLDGKVNDPYFCPICGKPNAAHRNEARTTAYHMSIDVAGALKNWTPHLWADCCTGDDGVKLSPDQVRVEFEKALAAGTRFLCFDPSCENFDPQRGCQGHWEPEAQS